MIDFHQQLRPASFRGLAFLAPEDSTEFGRRVESHEYPGRDDPYHEDMGLALQSFQIEAVIQGTSFVAAAAVFESALKKPGPGLLIHPHYGELEVIVKTARRSHSADAVGEVRFSFTVEKYGKPLFPVLNKDTAGGLTAAAGDTFNALLGDFNTAFSIPSNLDFLLQDATGRANDFTDILRGHLSTGGILRLFTGGWPDSWDVLNNFAPGVVGFFQSIAGLVRPSSSRIVGPSAVNPANGRDAVALIKALTKAADHSIADAGLAGTITQSTRVRNSESLDYLFRLGSLSAAAQAARYATYESREEALSIRAGAAVQLSKLRDDMGARGWDESWRAAGGLLAALSRDINDKIGRLPRTLYIQPNGLNSSLVIANRLYDDPAAIFARAADIAMRNAVRHPGFVPASQLEVLV